MGSIRLILALAVLLTHCPQGVMGRFIPAALAVQCFYAISGFLIQMVISESDRGPGWRRRFYLSRVLRIYPLYLVFVLLTLIFTPDGFLELYVTRQHWKAIAMYSLNNLLIVGQDVLRFFYFSVQTWHFMPQPTEAARAAIHGSIGGMTILGQSWTLAIELYFYLLAPFLLLRRTGVLVGLAVAFTALRFWLGYHGHFESEWYYGFFPSELPVFLLGALAFRFYRTFLESGRLARVIGRPALMAGATAAVILACAVYMTADVNDIPVWRWNAPPLGAPLEYWLILLLTVLILPLAFYFSRQCRWDRFMGELSYPIYLGHFLVLDLLTRNLHPAPQGLPYVGLFVAGICLLLAVSLILFVERPIDRMRHRLFPRGAGEKGAAS